MTKLPALPTALLDPRPVIIVGTTAWAMAISAALLIPALEKWLPVSIAGCALGVLGTALFLWQRAAARRGARSAQPGLVDAPLPEE